MVFEDKEYMLFTSMSFQGSIFYWFWREGSIEQYGPSLPTLVPTLPYESQVLYLCKDHTKMFYLVYGVLIALFFTKLSHRSLPEKGSFKK